LSRRNKRRSGLARLGVPRRGGTLYDLALTHRSHAFEQPTPTEHNERLEFLGDAVLGIVVTDLLFRAFPDLPEGDLARMRASLVNTQTLAYLARDIGLGDHLKLGRGEEGSGGRDKDSLLADVFEAVVGAVYIDRGLRAVTRALEPLFEEYMSADQDRPTHDAKTILQEFAVRQNGDRPVYRVASSGPDHDKRFTASVFISDELWGTGAGRSKKEAEQNAARVALAKQNDATSNGGGPDARAS
jgi:ribonuclease III